MTLTESICPKRTFITTFPPKSMINDGNIETCGRKVTHLMGINHCTFYYWRHAPVIEHGRSFPVQVQVIV